VKPVLFSEAEKPHILVVDDDSRICLLLTKYLRDQGFVVASAKDSFEADAVLERAEFDALVVDVMMPGRTGVEFVRALREKTGQISTIPVLLLTALGETENRITGLEAGADDYLAKPFEPKELLLRIKAILRRRPDMTAGRTLSSFRMGAWSYDPGLKELRQDGGEIVRLTAVESTLLENLARHAGKILSREELARLCGIDGNDRTIDVQVTRLRRKIGDDSRTPRYLQTIRGQGYLLRLDGPAGAGD
jgi:two-component system phosphate regulon response regulator OmpR